MEIKKVKYGYAIFSNGEKISKTFRKYDNARILATLLSW